MSVGVRGFVQATSRGVESSRHPLRKSWREKNRLASGHWNYNKNWLAHFNKKLFKCESTRPNVCVGARVVCMCVYNFISYVLHYKIISSQNYLKLPSHSRFRHGKTFWMTIGCIFFSPVQGDMSQTLRYFVERNKIINYKTKLQWIFRNKNTLGFWKRI